MRINLINIWNVFLFKTSKTSRNPLKSFILLVSDFSLALTVIDLANISIVNDSGLQ